MMDISGSTNAVEATNIVKKFGGVTALDDINFKVSTGNIHALIGENGAGKSTLVKILNGVYPAGTFQGEIFVNNQHVSFDSTARARASGIAYVPQEIEVLDQLSVAENIFAGHIGLNSRIWVNKSRLERRSKALLEDLGLSIDTKSIMASLNSAQRHLVMIARALALKPSVLILDEPTASFSSTEVDALFDVLKLLKVNGVTMIYITHRLAEVIKVCDSATVLRDGKIVLEVERNEFNQDNFISAMSGQRLKNLFPVRQVDNKSKPTILKIENLSVQGNDGQVHGVKNINFSIKEGEILGLAGLLGSGRSEILHGIFGRVPSQGNIYIREKKVEIRSPKDARAAGISLLTEDRKRDGLLFNLDLGANITIGNLKYVSKMGIINKDDEKKEIERGINALNVKTTSEKSSVSHLSGGNQQKVLFSRVLIRKPNILLLDEPTKGVDAATRAEIYRFIVSLAEQNVALLVVASELEEIVGICDRCLTISDGIIIDEFYRGEGDEGRILKSITDYSYGGGKL